jgi:hypothetical protein
MNYFLRNFGPLIIIVITGVTIFKISSRWPDIYTWFKEIKDRKTVASRREIVDRQTQKIDDIGLRNKDTVIRGLLDERSTLQNEITSLKGQITAKNEKIYKLNEINRSFKTSIDQLRADVEVQKSLYRGTSLPRDEKFASVKREFAKIYHPNNIKLTGMDKLIRVELFKEFWPVFERIEAT